MKFFRAILLQCGGVMNANSDVRPSGYVQRPRPMLGIGRHGLGGDTGQNAKVLTTRVGLQMPPALSFEDWEQAGCRLSGVLDSSSWWLGDWLVYGKDHYADRYQRGIRAAGLKYQTLRNYAWVARRFVLSRRRGKLRFQHHAEVASLTVDEQEWWLGRAEEMHWTTKQLRTSLRDASDGGSDAHARPAVTRRLAVPSHRVDCWRQAALHAGVDFEKWVWATLDNEARRALEDVEEQSGVRV
ncbi:LmbU family transcriptional regulator [Streptomyces sp. NPDC018045]|uniref:LmbU family transcriptional regulator n=1 Tax=Streptomyces sp. NPDC018045 TaxID=3365037 RepID=UPI0037B4BF36